MASSLWSVHTMIQWICIITEHGRPLLISSLKNILFYTRRKGLCTHTADTLPLSHKCCMHGHGAHIPFLLKDIDTDVYSQTQSLVPMPNHPNQIIYQILRGWKRQTQQY